ncbi:putative holin-like toxin [uncultured Streptococcus sp.]|nr:putative holin-like toxin [uncultured Streptococcus sp.]
MFQFGTLLVALVALMVTLSKNNNRTASSQAH